MKRMLRIFVLSALVGEAGIASAGVIADAQIDKVGDDAYVLTIRGSAPQSFDAITADGGRRVTVQLHAATLGKLHRPGRTAFGRVKLRGRAGDEVLLRLKLRSGWRAHVRQGASANAVEVRLTR